MGAKKKTWREKVNEIEAKIHTITPEMERRLGKGKSLVPKALDIERLINETKSGELLTNDLIRLDQRVLVRAPWRGPRPGPARSCRSRAPLCAPAMVSRSRSERKKPSLSEP